MKRQNDIFGEERTISSCSGDCQNYNINSKKCGCIVNAEVFNYGAHFLCSKFIWKKKAKISAKDVFNNYFKRE